MEGVIKRLTTTMSVCLFVLAAGVSLAQQPTTTTETRQFQVVSVDGNSVVIREPTGTRELTVPDDFRFNMNGQQLSVHELKPGMRGTATITTTTTVHPVTVTEMKSGTVMQVSGNSIIVRTPQGIRMFTEGDVEKRNVKILRDGQPAQLSDFHTGDVLTATIITEQPPKVMTARQVQASISGAAPSATSGTSPAPSAGTTSSTGTRASGGTAASRSGSPGAAPSAAASPSAAAAPGGATASPKRTLPKTASDQPLIGLVGAVSLAIGVFLTWFRRRRAV
jgi:LPXTG-motif cell wall-anchored protein